MAAIGRIFTRVINAFGIADLSATRFPVDIANRLRAQQLRGTISQMRVMVPCNTFFAPALSMQAWK